MHTFVPQCNVEDSQTQSDSRPNEQRIWNEAQLGKKMKSKSPKVAKIFIIRQKKYQQGNYKKINIFLECKWMLLFAVHSEALTWNVLRQLCITPESALLHNLLQKYCKIAVLCFLFKWNSAKLCRTLQSLLQIQWNNSGFLPKERASKSCPAKALQIRKKM